MQEFARQATGDPERPDADWLAVDRRLGTLLAIGTQADTNRGQFFKWSMLFLGTAATVVIVGIHATLVNTLSQGLLLVVLSLVVLQCSVGLMTLSLSEMAKARRLSNQFPPELHEGLTLDPGPIIGDMMTGLEGRVGSAMHIGNRVIPLVVLEGNAPREPEYWLKLRAAAKMRLLEVRDGVVPNYGLLVYDDGVLRVDNSDALQQDLIDSVQAMSRGEPIVASA